MLARHPVPAAAHTDGVRTRLTLWFFRHFFTLLLVAISAAEVVMLWWLSSSVVRIPAIVCAFAIPALYAANFHLAARRRMPGPVGALPAAYYIFAFTSIFCVVFLMATGALWASSKLVLGAIAAQAMTVGASGALSSGIDTTFRWLANLGVTTIALSFVYGYSIGQRRLKIRRIPIPMRRAPAAWHGLKIVQISDIHVGQNLEADELRHFVERVNAQQPDIVCITGDIADSARSDLDAFFPILAQLQAKHGVFAILGNHDHYAGPERVIAALQRHTAFTVLRDEAATIDIRGHSLAVVGLDDRGRDWARGMLEDPALDRTLLGVDKSAPVLLLCHRPDAFMHAARCGVDLTLSGHTHGGQIAMPWINGRTRNLAQFVTRFDRGRFERNGSFLYVNCGLGVTGQRIRLCTPREITILEIQSVAAAQAAA